MSDKQLTVPAQLLRTVVEYVKSVGPALKAASAPLDDFRSKVGPTVDTLDELKLVTTPADRTKLAQDLERNPSTALILIQRLAKRAAMGPVGKPADSGTKTASAQTSFGRRLSAADMTFQAAFGPGRNRV